MSKWPRLSLGEWAGTRSTLHRWLQIAGKIRLVQTPWLNHSWPATLYVTARGLTTSPIVHEGRTFQIDFDFIDHGFCFPMKRSGRQKIRKRFCSTSFSPRTKPRRAWGTGTARRSNVARSSDRGDRDASPSNGEFYFRFNSHDSAPEGHFWICSASGLHSRLRR